MSLIRSVALGTAELTISNVLVRVISLLAMPLLTSLLGPGAFGAAALVTTFISLVSVIALAGADLSYIRAYHAEKPQFRHAVELVTWRFALGSSIVAAFLSILCWNLISDVLLLPFYAGPLIAAGVILSVTMAMTKARARLDGRYRAISIATMASGAGATAIAIGVAYCGRRDALPLILSLLATYLIPVLFLGLPPLPRLLSKSGLSFVHQKHILGMGAATIVTAPAYWVISSSDRWFLKLFQDTNAVGIYSISCSVAIAGMAVHSAILTIWTPEATRLYESRSSTSLEQLGNITELMIVVLACTWLAVTAAGGDIVRLVTAPAFHAGAVIIPFVAGGVFLYGIGYLAHTAYLLEKRVHHTIPWWAGGAIACLIFNAILVPWIGLAGAGLAQLLSFAVPAVGLMTGARHVLLGCIGWLRLAVVSITVFAAALLMLPSWAETPFESLLMKFPVGLTISLFVTLVFRRDASFFFYKRGLP